MAKNKEDPKLTRLTDHIEDTISDEEEIETVKLPQQDAFFKMPKRFGTVPDVSKKPLGWGKGGYEHLYPHVNLPAQRLDTLSFGVQGDPNKLYWGDNHPSFLLSVSCSFFFGAQCSVLSELRHNRTENNIRK